MKNPNNNRFSRASTRANKQRLACFQFQNVPGISVFTVKCSRISLIGRSILYTLSTNTVFSLNWCSYELKIKTIINKMRICEKYENFYDDSYLKLSNYRCNGTNSWFKYYKMHIIMAFKALITWHVFLRFFSCILPS